jgi:hypothetical protein
MDYLSKRKIDKPLNGWKNGDNLNRWGKRELDKLPEIIDERELTIMQGKGEIELLTFRICL